MRYVAPVLAAAVIAVSSASAVQAKDEVAFICATVEAPAFYPPNPGAGSMQLRRELADVVDQAVRAEDRCAASRPARIAFVKAHGDTYARMATYREWHGAHCETKTVRVIPRKVQRVRNGVVYTEDLPWYDEAEVCKGKTPKDPRVGLSNDECKLAIISDRCRSADYLAGKRGVELPAYERQSPVEILEAALAARLALESAESDGGTE